MSGSPDQSPNAATQSDRRHLARRRLAALVVVGTAFGWFMWHVASQRPPDDRRAEEVDPSTCPVENADPFALPAIAATRFRNASKDVAYVGTRACVECHAGEHETYLQTNHSRSLAAIDVSREPPDGEFFHELSGRHYRVYREGKTLRLREFIRDSQDREVVLVDRAARFAIGSGNYARSYLVQEDDFLVEAPMTWYPRRKWWNMSAGYEKDPLQPGFTREIGWGCMHCHSGRTERIGEAELRMRVTEAAIGCERCHGPGALHVKEREAGLPLRGIFDDSIVNPRHLSRHRQEDICSQCHLSAVANVAVRGRSVADFRPGMRMSDFRVGYRVDRVNSTVSVSGQVQQMRLSRCYIESKTMTCITCHDLHSPVEESKKVAYYRGKCLNCHQPASCGLPVEKRNETKPADNCIACHMPKSRTDIPHLSFSHHRVGIHPPQSGNIKYTAADELVPVVDVSRFPEHERLRQLGLANDEFGANLIGGLDDESRGDPSYRALGVVFAKRGRRLLEQVRALGLRDPVVDAYFSRIYWRKNPDRCIANALSALKSPQISPETRHHALFHLASSYFDRGQYDRALPYLRELVTIEREAISLMLLGICYEKRGDLREAAHRMNEAILADPARADLHDHLALVYRKMGRPDEAKKHLQRAKLLKRTVPQSRRNR